MVVKKEENCIEDSSNIINHEIKKDEINEDDIKLMKKLKNDLKYKKDD